MGITVLLVLIYIICGIITAVFNKELLTIIMIISGIIFYIAFICFIIWIEYCWSFATHLILYDNSGVFESLPKSFNLVKKNWWRVFGNTFIVTLGVSFAVSMVTTPILIFSFLPIYIKFFQMYINHDFSNLSSLLQGNAVYFAVGGLAVSMILRVAAYALVYPVYYSLMFINLKVRKKEIRDEVNFIQDSIEDNSNL
jgi:hypothetical protein